MQLCYLGIAEKCYEIVEFKPGSISAHSTASGVNDHAIDEEDADDEDDDDDNDGEDADDENEEDEDDDDEEEESDDEEPVDEDDDSVFEDTTKAGVRLKLREILFYDDKIAVFKARHGRL